MGQSITDLDQPLFDEVKTSFSDAAMILETKMQQTNKCNNSRQKLSYVSTFAESARFQVPKNGTSDAETKKTETTF